MSRFTSVLLSLAIATSVRGAGPPPSRPPNVVFIIADDLGWGDLGCYGQKRIRTPRLDAMAAQGIRFTQMYSGNAVCAPSRCVLATGKHPGHAAIRNNREHKPEGQEPLPDAELTIFEAFKSAAYSTGGFGKWGLGYPGSSGEPLKQGIDRWYGYICQAKAHTFYPTYLWDDDKLVTINDPAVAPYGKLEPMENPLERASYARFNGKNYSADLINSEARKFVKQNKDHPFFCYVPTTVPHLALQVPDDSLDEYLGQLGDDPPYTGGKGYLPNFAPHAAYAAMITRMDREIGRMMDLIDELGLDENTIFVFTSDNGGLGGPHQGLAGTDAKFFDSCGGLRAGKGSLYEGGVRVPGIVRWTGKIKPGQVSDRVCGFEDWMPTMLDLAGLAERTPAGIDGISFAPTLRGQSQAERSFLYREFPSYGGQQMVRMGNWKLVRQNMLSAGKAKGKKAGPPRTQELFDLAADPYEQKDIASDNPEIVAKMEVLLKSQHSPNAVFPFPGLD